VDELGGVFADDADAEKLLIGAGEDEFEHPCRVAVMCPRALLAYKRAADDVVDSLFLAGFFGFAGSEISGIV